MGSKPRDTRTHSAAVATQNGCLVKPPSRIALAREHADETSPICSITSSFVTGQCPLIFGFPRPLSELCPDVNSFWVRVCRMAAQPTVAHLSGGSECSTLAADPYGQCSIFQTQSVLVYSNCSDDRMCPATGPLEISARIFPVFPAGGVQACVENRADLCAAIARRQAEE